MILHLFYKCDITKEFWDCLIPIFGKCLNLLYLTLQTTFLGFINIYCNDILLINHIPLLSKVYVYNSRKHEQISLYNLVKNVTKATNMEKEIAAKNEKMIRLYNKKWKKIINNLTRKFSLINLSKG